MSNRFNLESTLATVDGWTLQGMECERDILVEVWSRIFGVDICTWNGLDFDQPMLAVRGACDFIPGTNETMKPLPFRRARPLPHSRKGA